MREGLGGGGFWSKGSFRFVLRLERDGYGSVLSMEEGIVQVLHRFGKCSGIESCKETEEHVVFLSTVF